jgi:3'-5' exoribonuclease
MSDQQSLQPGEANGRPSVRELADGQGVEGAFAVRERELRQKKDGNHFLKLTVSDRTGSTEAISWDEAEDRYKLAEPGSVVMIAGRFTVHQQYGSKITIDAIRPARAEEYSAEDLAEGPTQPVERLESDLRELIATIQHPQLQALLDRIFGRQSKIWQRFREAPAAKLYHEAYRHGLLEHTLSVAQGVSAAASAFPGIDRDIAVTGALLHDIGKTRAYNSDPLSIEFTDAGRLQGEIPLGYYMVRREIERIEGFDLTLAQAILHIILSHHGALEHGSPVIPATREATLVHTIDNLGGKLGSFDRLERALPDGEAWSRYDRALEGSAFFASRAA